MLNEGKKDKAINLLNLIKEKFPSEIVPYDLDDDDIAVLWWQCGVAEEANRVAKDILSQSVAKLRWLESLPGNRLVSYGYSCRESMESLLSCYQLLNATKGVTPEIAAEIEMVLDLQSARIGYSHLN
jgi:hypothetical protein